MRRIVLADPFARSAIWSRNLAIFALLVAVLGVLLARRGLDPEAALAIESGALGLAALSLLCAVVAMGVIWQTGFRVLGLAFGGLALSLGLFAYPAYLAVQARSSPSVIDVSTDLDNPPPFLQTAKALAARHGLTPPPPTAADKALQRRLYPDLDSLSFDAEAMDVEKAIRKVIKRHRWTPVDEVEPIRFQTGHIDLVVKTAIMGFPADLTFRIRSFGNRTQVDIRSVARAGWQEQPGSNAARVQELVNDLDEELSAS